VGEFGDALGYGASEETLAGDGDENWKAESVEVAEAREKWIVFVEALAESESGIDDKRGAGDSVVESVADTGAELLANQGHDVMFGGEKTPLVRESADVHDDGAAGALGDGAGHGWVPGEAADIVDNFNSGIDGYTGDRRFICVDGEDGFGALLFDGLDDGKDAGEFLLGRDGSGKGWGFVGCGGNAGACGFAADVEDVGTFIEQGQAVSDGGLRIAVKATVGEGVGGDVEDSHDKGALTEPQRTATYIPLELRTHIGAIVAGIYRRIGD
jgi:hypothetical protein